MISPLALLALLPVSSVSAPRRVYVHEGCDGALEAVADVRAPGAHDHHLHQKMPVLRLVEAGDDPIDACFGNRACISAGRELSRPTGSTQPQADKTRGAEQHHLNRQDANRHQEPGRAAKSLPVPR